MSIHAISKLLEYLVHLLSLTANYISEMYSSILGLLQLNKLTAILQLDIFILVAILYIAILVAILQLDTQTRPIYIFIFK